MRLISPPHARQIRALPHLADGTYSNLDIDGTIDFMTRRYVTPMAQRYDLSEVTLADGAAGYGWLSIAFLLRGGRDAILIDPDARRLENAEEICHILGVANRCRFVNRTLQETGLENDSVDIFASIETLEHVGRPNYPNYFETIAERLDPAGVALVHTIGRADGPGETDPWTRKYIFPGGYCPALSEVMPVVEQTGLWATDIEILRLHYAHTLERWYDRVQASQREIEALYDARFFRMWSFYLASAITAFRHGGHCNFQIQLAPRRDTVPLTRRYMERTEDRYRAEPAWLEAAE